MINVKQIIRISEAIFLTMSISCWFLIMATLAPSLLQRTLAAQRVVLLSFTALYHLPSSCNVQPSLWHVGEAAAHSPNRQANTKADEKQLITISNTYGALLSYLCLPSWPKHGLCLWYVLVLWTVHQMMILYNDVIVI